MLMTVWTMRLIGGLLLLTTAATTGALVWGRLPPERGEIVASVDYSNRYAQIHLLHRDRDWRYTLTPGRAGNYQPDWSPDGTRIVFSSNRDDNREIYTMTMTGADLQRLTHDDALDDQPVWSPDGRAIAYSSNRGGSRDIFLMRADGSQQRNLSPHPAIDTRPHWLPDGRLAFVSDRTGTFDIYILDVQTGDLQRLTNGVFNYRSAVWSPDSEQIALMVGGGVNAEIVLRETFTGVTRQLTDNSVLDVPVGWLPAGNRLIFQSRRNGQRAVYTMNPDGSQVRALDDLGLRTNQFAFYPVE